MLVHSKFSEILPYLYSVGLTLATGILMKPTMLNLGIAEIKGTVETVLALITVVSVIATGLVKARNHIRRVTKALDDLTALPAQFGELKTEVSLVHNQLLPNGGNSVSDRVDKLTAGQVQTNETLTTLASSLTALARKQQASFHLSERNLLEFNAAGHCIFANRTYLRYTGRTEAELMGSGWTSVFHPEDQRKLLDAWDRAVETHSSMEVFVRISDVKGDYAQGTFQMTPITTTQGLVAWLGVFTPDKPGLPVRPRPSEG